MGEGIIQEAQLLTPNEARALPNLEIFCAPDMNNQFRIKNIRNGIFLTSPLQFD